jgi:hypothetical protein
MQMRERNPSTFILINIFLCYLHPALHWRAHPHFYTQFPLTSVVFIYHLRKKRKGGRRSNGWGTAMRAGQLRYGLTPRLVLNEDGPSSTLASGCVIGSQNGFLHGFLFQDRLKPLQSREPKMALLEQQLGEREGRGGSGEGAVREQWGNREGASGRIRHLVGVRRR